MLHMKKSIVVSICEYLTISLKFSLCIISVNSKGSMVEVSNDCGLTL